MPETPKTPPPDHLDIWLVEQNARPMWAFAWGTAPTETETVTCYRVGHGVFLVQRFRPTPGNPRGGWEAWVPASRSLKTADTFIAMEEAAGLRTAPKSRTAQLRDHLQAAHLSLATGDRSDIGWGTIEQAIADARTALAAALELL